LQLNRLLQAVERPARYTGGEWNAVTKDFEAAELRVALCYPDVYEIGMSGLGVRILYDIVNSNPEWLCERVFCPWLDMERELRESQTPLFSLESRRPLREFDILGFSLGHELCYTNVLTVLDLGAIPLHSRDRGDEDPLVLAGGTCCMNPEPVADFIDAFVIGDGEEAIVEVCRAWQETQGEARPLRLQALSALDGVYVPSITEGGRSVRRRAVESLERAPFPLDPIVPSTEIVHDRVAVEIMRGCPHACRFCQATACYAPVRTRSIDRIVELADANLKATGYDEVSLVALSATDYPGIEELVALLADRYAAGKVSISLPSLRPDPRWIRLAAKIQKVRKTGLTLAPEAGSEDLRSRIGKPAVEEDLLAAVTTAFELGWRRVKLYFMIGLPGEQDEDIKGIGKLVHAVAARGKAARAGVQVSASISTFVPKPGARYERAGQASIEEIERKLAVLKSSLSKRDARLSWHQPFSSRLEAVLSRGDRALGMAIETAWQLGARFDSWDDRLRPALWEKAFSDCDIDMAPYAEREIPAGEAVPWSFLSGSRRAEAAVG
jgi:radical SAM superfamily enzyme YgiQ (UPF0313 family)